MTRPTLRSDQRGGPALEFALVVPALLMFVLGMFSVYSLSSAKRAMDFGLERALRYAAINSGTSTSSVVNAYCAAAIIINGDVGGTTKCTSANVTVSPSVIVAGSPVTVTATYSWSAPAGYTLGTTPQFATMNLSATGTIRVLH